MEFNELNEDPVKSIFYNYKGKDFLCKNLEELIDIENVDHIHICPYEVNKEGRYPFLKFLLHKNEIFNNLQFLKLYFDLNEVNSSEEIINITKRNLFEILCCQDNKVNFNETVEINGFYLYEGDVFLFVDVTNCKLNINDIYSENNLWFALIHEIYNIEKVFSFKIDSFVIRFFNDNYNFCILENEKNEIYENPIVGYVSKLEQKLIFTYHFGEIKQNKNAILGPYYYFTDYKTAIKNAYHLSASNKKNAGIVKFALFTGTTKYVENFPNDDIDNSETKKQRLNDETLDKVYEQLTIRISDHDGLWSKTHDSSYLGNIVLENGSYLKETPWVVLKEYEQQISLSYHYVNNVAFENNQFLIV